MASHLWSLQTFDPNEGFTIIERRLPHWAQPGTLCFLTWRTFDSMPRSVLNRWYADREEWLRKRNIDPHAADWRTQLAALGQELHSDFVRTFSARWQRNLDFCHGACWLAQPALSQIVADSLLKFDGDRYQLTDFIVMPNHVHVLAAFIHEERMLSQCTSWKHFTATQINRHIGKSGPFWQQDGFDRLIRNENEFEKTRRYIAENGQRAGLKPMEYRHYSKPLASTK
ncbi:MAG: hypothetical protein Q8K78_15060 [Planctomycetaceae bacterium]|nr:hypothetical protein [Planctomycetaceae bacterium]